MNLKLLSLFVKDINSHTPKSHRDCGKAAGIIGILSNLLLFAIKLIIGIMSSSIAIVADAVNNIFDAGSSIITLIGYKIAEKPADAKHPYGHARIDYLTGFIVSLIVTVVGVQFFKDSIISISEKAVSNYSKITILVLVISIIIKFWQSRFYLAVGKHTGSGSLIAVSADSRNDMISTTAVLVGAIISKFTGVVLDGYLGLLISIFIIYSGIKLVMETADPILGVAPEKELVDSIAQKIMSYDGILGIHDLIVHNYGEGRCFASVHCEVSASEDVLKSHDLIDNIEFYFLKEENMQLVIHMDPVVDDNEEINSLREKVKIIVNNIAEKLNTHMSMHDFRAVVGPTHTNLIFDVVLSYDLKVDENIIINMIKSEISKISPSYNAVINIDHDFTNS